MLAAQACNGKQSELYNFKPKLNRKRENISATNRFILSFLIIRVVVSSFVFD